MATRLEAGGEKVLVHFSKMHGLGNDFVMLTDLELTSLVAEVRGELPAKAPVIDKFWIKQFCSGLSSLLCDRRFGIGADGLIVAIDLERVKQEKQAVVARKGVDRKTADENQAFWLALDQYTSSYPQRDQCELAWIYVNSDGSYAEMCGNGLRCFALFVREQGMLKKAACTVATLAYPVTVTIKNEPGSGTAGGGDQGRMTGSPSSIEVVTRLAGPNFACADIPLDTKALAPGAVDFVDQTIDVNGLKLQATSLSMGNPHCVIFEQENIPMSAYAVDIELAHDAGRALDKFPQYLVDLAGDIQKLSLFPRGANIEFVRLEADAEPANTAIVFVVERGCGATLACASGAAAVVAAGVKSGLLNKRSYVILPGGQLEVSLSSVKEEEHVQEYIELTGPAVKVFSGEVALSLSALLAGACSSASEGGADASHDSSLKNSTKSCASSSEKLDEGLCV